jgi:poly(3-hydroxybutyrate) depolymerase
MTALVLALFGGACSTAAPIPERTENFETKLEVEGLLRTYQVHVPTGYTGEEEHPLLLALHGSGFGGDGIRRSTGLDTSDPLIPFEGDTATGELALLSTAATMETWALRNGCATSPETSTAYVDPVYGIPTRLSRYPHCASGLDVVLYAMEGAGHIWPATVFPANTAIAEFFLLHQQ